MFDFVVVESPTITRRVDISVSGKAPKKLEMKWAGLSINKALELVERYQRDSAFWVDDDGEPLSLDDAARDFVYLSGTDGAEIPVPRLHDYVVERKLRERLEAQQAFLQDMIQGPDGCLVEWNLAIKGDLQDFNDPEVYEMVFSSNEFFFPVLSDFIEMLNEVSGGKDKEKNSKSSGKSSQHHRGGRMRA